MSAALSEMSDDCLRSFVVVCKIVQYMYFKFLREVSRVKSVHEGKGVRQMYADKEWLGRSRGE